jgi:CHAT domain-containing protein
MMNFFHKLGQIAVNFLTESAHADLIAAIGEPLSARTPQEAFLLEVLPITMRNINNLQLVYPFLQANIDKLDDYFAQWLRIWASDTLSRVTFTQAARISSAIGVFGNLILEFPLGSKASNVEISIAAYEIALQVQTYEAFPGPWAQTQHNLAAAYFYRIRGNRSENIEMAINCCENALLVRTRSSRPQQWASTQVHLAIAYCNRILGVPSENMEKAIAYYENSLQILTRKTSPEQWAKTQHNLANAYSHRIQGNRSENLEQAITCCHNALQIRTLETFPQQWATTKNILGTIYQERIVGDPIGNLELAIECYKNALQVCTHETYPQLRCAIQNNLGNAYMNRLWVKNWENKENLEKAINCFQDALQIFTPQDLPEQWAIIQINLGTAYSDQFWGNPELAVECYENALQVYTFKDFPKEWAMIQNHLGATCSESITYYYFKNEEYVPGSEIEILEKGIKYLENALHVYTLQDFPQAWAMVQNNLANIYTNLTAKGKIENFPKAISCCKNALQVYTNQASPYYISSVFNLGIAYQAAKELHNAYTAFASAIDNVEFLRYQKISGDRAKQAWASKWSDLYQKMVEVCLELGTKEPHYYAKAIEYIERSKARNLLELLYNLDIYPKGVSQDICNKLKRLRQEIAAEQNQLAIAQRKISSGITLDEGQQRQENIYLTTSLDYTRLNELQQQLDGLIENQIKPIDANFSLTQQIEPISFSQIQALLNENTAIIEWYITPEYFRAFVITRQSEYPLVHQFPVWQSLPPKTEADWPAWMLDYLNYLTAYGQEDKTQWKTHLSEHLQDFAQSLNLNEILKLLPETCSQLILIPHRALHLVPFHALPLGDGTWLLDRFPKGVRYAPSCQLLQLSQNLKRSYFTHLFAIKDPTEDLIFANIEVSAIKQYFDSVNVNVLEKTTATKASIKINQDLPLANCIHFSCHGKYNWVSPLESALILANKEPLTLGEIFELTLNQGCLVTLSACEAGITDLTSISDEYIGLPNGFLVAGSSSVVSSLWTADDFSTFFLMMKFYENLRKRPTLEIGDVGIALNEAQKWLRDLTSDECEKRLDELQSQITSTHNQLPKKESRLVEAAFKGARKQIRARSPHPFANPYYWAAFTATGL